MDAAEAGTPSSEPDAKQADEKQADGDFTDMLSELRVLLPGAQLLSAFLTTVPFTSGFSAIIRAEKYVFLATFILAVSSLVLLTAPAVQHRMLSPLVDRARFKQVASKQILVGAAALSLALVLVTQLVLSEVLGYAIGTASAGFIALLALAIWWVWPRIWRAYDRV